MKSEVLSKDQQVDMFDCKDLCTCVWTLDVKETKGYLNYIDSLGGQSQAWFECMGRVAKPKTLSKTESPDVLKRWSML